MRVYFKNTNKPKIAAKHLAKMSDCSLSACQKSLAKSLGYTGWDELHSVSLSCSAKHTILDALADEVVTPIVVQLTKELNLAPADVLFALSRAGIVSCPAERSIYRHLSLTCKAYRETTIPFRGKRQAGEVGEINAPGFNSTRVILRSASDGVSALTHKHPSAMFGLSEYKSPNRQLSLFVPARFYVAYGKADLKNGTKILFSRDRIPMWELNSDRRPHRIKPSKSLWGEHQIEYFWDDNTAPWRDEQRLAEEVARLTEYGVRELPWLVNLLPLFLKADLESLYDVSDALSSFGLQGGRSDWKV